ncbi:MAG TPA: ferrous iron transport protein A [Bacillus bacterium]|nr:ferrous iron transport protein A [Bacillus sp. (in: firmicutes)]
MVLAELKQGEKARIRDFSKLSDIVRRRLIDMGIYEGVEVCLKCNMPFGGPYMIETFGQCVGIRRHEAGTIRVEKVC